MTVVDPIFRVWHAITVVCRFRSPLDVQTRPGIKLFVTCGIASACDVRVSTRNCNIRHVACIVPHLAQVMQFLPSGASRCVIVATIMVRSSSYPPHRLAQPHQRLSSLPAPGINSCSGTSVSGAAFPFELFFLCFSGAAWRPATVRSSPKTRRLNALSGVGGAAATFFNR